MLFFSVIVVFTLIVNYGGSFIHVPEKSYSSNSRRTYKNVDLHNLSVDELKISLGEVVAEFSIGLLLFV